MGRPVNKRNFGTQAGAGTTFTIRYHDGTASREGWIVAQKGTNKFKCDSTAGTAATCRLVNELTPNASGECAIVGFVDDGNAVILQKIFNRTAVDWSGNRYTWEIQDDSTQSLLVLTAI